MAATPASMLRIVSDGLQDRTRLNTPVGRPSVDFYRAVLRRRGGATPAEAPVAAEGERLVFGELHIDVPEHRVRVGADTLDLTATEFKLLLELARRKGRVLSRGALLENVWEVPPDLNTRTVDTHVKRLREKLGPAAAHLETVRGVGYRFNATPTDRAGEA